MLLAILEAFTQLRTQGDRVLAAEREAPPEKGSKCLHYKNIINLRIRLSDLYYVPEPIIT